MMTKKIKNRVPDCIYKLCTSLLPRANAGVAVVTSDKEVLLLRRVKGTTKGNWELPSGGIEMNKTPQETAKRELKEETTIPLTVKQLREIGTVTACHIDRTDVVTTFLVYPYDDKNQVKLPLDDPEHDCFCWMPLNKCRSSQLQMHPATKKQLRMAHSEIKRICQP